MSEEIKFTEDEMNQLRDIQNEYSNIQGELGQNNIARLTIEDRLNDLMKKEDEIRKKFFELQKKEKSFLDETTKKYGEGNLNPETGVFVPNKSS